MMISPDFVPFAAFAGLTMIASAPVRPVRRRRRGAGHHRSGFFSRGASIKILAGGSAISVRVCQKSCLPHRSI